MTRWGIIGAGNIARRFAKSLAHDSRAELVAVSCRTAEKAEAARAELGAKREYAGHELLLGDPDIDAVYLALPHGLHKEWAIRALKAGKAVLCEKPAALSAAEADEMAQAAREEGRLFMEAMKPRFVPLYAQLKSIIDSGGIGCVERVEATLCNDMLVYIEGRNSYHTDPAQGGALLDSGTYCASWLEDFLPKGADPALSSLVASTKDDLNIYVDAELSFGTAKARLECAFDRAKPRCATLVGTKGRIVVEELHRPIRATVFCDGKDPLAIEAPYEVDDFFGEIRHFNDLLETGATESPVMPLSASLGCARILDTIAAGLTVNESTLDALVEQERLLRYVGGFGSAEALFLGNRIVALSRAYDRGVSVRIARDADDLTLFAWAADDKAPRNDIFINGKIAASRTAGHSSAWCWAKHEQDGSWAEFFDATTPEIPAAGAFPIFSDGARVATACVSGLHEGQDHALVVRALEEELRIEAPRIRWVLK